jgi:hypothetical protein
MHRSVGILVAGLCIQSAGAASSAEQEARVARTFKPLPANAVADYQLGGAYDPPAGTTVVVRDSTAAPAQGLYNVCYVNGFQTQPGVAWPARLLVRNSKGKPLVDPDWPDEHLLDISSEKLRTAVLERLAVTIAECAHKGFDAVEFDNLDSFTRSKGALKHKDAVAFAELLVRAAHEQGLAAGQKNTPQLSDGERRRIGFDFVVSEECHRYDECSAYTRFYGDRVINIEYGDDLRAPFADICADAATPRDTILRDRGLNPAQRAPYRYDHCVAHRSVRQ